MNKNTTIPKIIFSSFLTVTILFTSCSKDADDVIDPDTPDPTEYDRTSLLTNYANAYIKPAYAEYETKVNELKMEVATFNSALTVSALQSLRTKWQNALLTWQDVAFLEFGPASAISLRAQTNVYPIDSGLIKSNITSGIYNLQLGDNFVAKGFQAVDFLLYGVEVNDADIVTYFTNSTNARTYLQDVVDELKTNASYVKNEWYGSYSSTFIANSASNADGSSISDIVNALNLHYEKYLRNGKLGFPLNVFDPFTTQTFPEKVEAFYHGQSLPYVYRSLNSLQTFINGNAYNNTATGIGLDDYMVFVNAQTGGQPLQTVINNHFADIQTALNTINDPLSNEINANNQGVTSVYQKIQQMVAYIKVDMSDAIEVIITYDSGDGD